MTYHVSMLERQSKVYLTKRADKELTKAPNAVKDSFQDWVTGVEMVGLREMRKIPGLHDEPLKGDRKGQRSVRLSGKWRAIYTENETKQLTVVTVEEVTPHAY